MCHCSGRIEYVTRMKKTRAIEILDKLGVLFEMRSWARFLLPTKYVAVYYPTPEYVLGGWMNCTAS